MRADHEADSLRHRSVMAAGVRLHVVEAGDVTAPLVLLLHGFPESWRSWQGQIRALAAAGFRVMAPDLRGFNESERPRRVRDYQLERIADDVAVLVRASGAPSVSVVGHDWGGLAAWELAMHHPGLLDRLVVINAPHPVTLVRGLRRPRQALKCWYMFFFQLPWWPERYLRTNELRVLRGALASSLDPDTRDHFVEAMARTGALTAAINYYRAAFRQIVTRSLRPPRRIDVPVMVIWGERDRHLMRDLATPPRSLVSDVRIEWLPAASHWVHADASEQVNALLLEFLGAATGARRPTSGC